MFYLLSKQSSQKLSISLSGNPAINVFVTPALYLRVIPPEQRLSRDKRIAQLPDNEPLPRKPSRYYKLGAEVF